jgi:hypothetical protein
LRAILSGDTAQIMQLLSPQINAAKTSAQNQKLSNAEFGARTGGNAAANTSIDNSLRSDITGLVGNATNTAASTLGSRGTELLGEGMEGNQAAFGEADTMQKQRAARWNDLFNSIASTAGSVAGGVGNLDTTGGSSGQEQLMNFLTGAGGGTS